MTSPAPAETPPMRIEHKVDTDLDERTGACSFHYNFLLYTFPHAEGPVIARCYLDRPSEVALLLSPGRRHEDPAVAGILRYLRIRFSRIARLTAEGYVDL